VLEAEGATREAGALARTLWSAARDRPGPGPADLAPDVTRVALAGMTNREIGTRLFVSPRTVQTHVSHILQKTGLRSRVEIARFAHA
jgi:DNA-binding NarL/FixJ family response regulator